MSGLVGRTSNNHAPGKHTLKYSPRLSKAVFNLAYRNCTQSGFHGGPEESGGAAEQRGRSARPSGPATLPPRRDGHIPTACPAALPTASLSGVLYRNELLAFSQLFWMAGQPVPPWRGEQPQEEPAMPPLLM